MNCLMSSFLHTHKYANGFKEYFIHACFFPIQKLLEDDDDDDDIYDVDQLAVKAEPGGPKVQTLLQYNNTLLKKKKLSYWFTNAVL